MPPLFVQVKAEDSQGLNVSEYYEKKTLDFKQSLVQETKLKINGVDAIKAKFEYTIPEHEDMTIKTYEYYLTEGPFGYKISIVFDQFEEEEKAEKALDRIATSFLYEPDSIDTINISSEPGKYVHSYYNYSIEYPSKCVIEQESRDWILIESPKVNPSDAYEYQVKVDVHQLDTELDLDEYYDSTFRGYYENDKLIILSEDESIINGERAKVIEYSEGQYVEIVYLFLKNDYRYLVSFRTTKENLESLRNEFEEIINTFHFVE